MFECVDNPQNYYSTFDTKHMSHPEVALDFFAARHFDGQDRKMSVKIHYYPTENIRLTRPHRKWK